ncbi:MAG TPA: hypothetical protein VIW29_01680 [Polyangiaceae bacterium]
MKVQPFNRVGIREQDRTRMLSCEEFLALPLHERVQHILSRSVDFFDGQQPVELKAALAWLRTTSASR